MKRLVNIITKAFIALYLLSYQGMAHAIFASDLEGTWKNSRGDLVRIEKSPNRTWQGRLILVNPGSQQVGYKINQKIIRNIRVNGKSVTFEFSATDVNPLIAARCQQKFVKYQGSYLVNEKQEIKISGEHQELEFELPWEPGEPCGVKVLSGWQLNDFTKIPERNFSLKNLQIDGFMHCQGPDFEPPYIPYNDVPADGHFRAFIPKEYFPKLGNDEYKRDEKRIIASLFKKDPTDTAWVAISSSPVSLPRCTQPAFSEGLGSSPSAAVEDRFDTPHTLLGLPLRPGNSDLIIADFMPGKLFVAVNINPAAKHYPIHLDDFIEYKDYAGHLWELINRQHSKRMFKVTFKATAVKGQGSLNIETPVFSKDEIFQVLKQRLNALTKRLLNMSLTEFDAQYSRQDGDGKNVTKYKLPKAQLWKGFVKSSSNIQAFVDVENSLLNNTRHEMVLRLMAKFADNSEIELDKKSVILGAKNTEAEKIPHHVPMGLVTQVKFDEVALDKNTGINAKNINKLKRIYIKTDPAWAGGSGSSTIEQKLSAEQLKNIKAFIGFATTLKNMASSADTNPWSRSNIKSAAIRKPGQRKRIWAKNIDTSESARLYSEEQYKEFVRLHKIYFIYWLSQGSSELDKLDRYIRSRPPYRTFGVKFDDYSKQESVVAEGVDNPGGYTKKVFVLSQSKTNAALSFVSATLNPQLSFALDPTTFSLLAGEEDSDITLGSELKGVTNWVHQSGNRTADFDEASKRLKSSPAMQDAYKKLTGGRGDHARLSTELKRKIKTGELDAVRGRLFEEIMISPLLKAENERLKKLKQSGSDKPVFVETLVLDGSQIAGGSNSDKNISAGELTDGMILGKTQDGQWHIVRIAEAKSGAPGAKGIFAQFRKNLRRMLNANINLKKLRPDQQAKLGISTQTHSFGKVGSQKGLKANFSNPDLYIPFVVADADFKLPPVPASGEGRGVAAIRKAMQERVARSPLTTQDTHLMARILFKKAGVTPEAWFKIHANFSDFQRITRRSAKARRVKVPKQAVLEKMFAEGKRLNPKTGKWDRVIPKWQQPVLHVDDVVAMAKKHYVDNYKARNNQKEPPKDVLKAKIKEFMAKAREGKRFNPETKRGSWPSFGTPKYNNKDGTLKTRTGSLHTKYRAPILDPLSPTLTDAEKRIWIKYSGQLPTKPGAKQRFIDNFMKNHQAFDLQKRRFRPLSDREKLLRNMLKSNPDYAAAYNRRIKNMDTAADVAERLAAATAETAKILRERVKVYVYHNNSTGIYVTVVPVVVYQNGRKKPLAIPYSYQKGLLQKYYKYSENMFFERDLPKWLK